MMKKYSHRKNNIEKYLPYDTKMVIDKISNKIEKHVENFSLRLNRFIDFKDYKCMLPDVKINQEVYSKLISNLQMKQQYVLKQWNGPVKFFVFQNDWRMVHGIGLPSVYETSLTLHHIYGIPYIPAQSIKGILRSYVILELFAKKENGEFDPQDAEKRALEDQTFCDIFGHSHKPNSENDSGNGAQGKIRFFDAFPVEVPSIQKDIMNPHYALYYNDPTGKIPPADYFDPVPIFFLTVKRGKFRVYIGETIKYSLSSVNPCWMHGLNDRTQNLTLLDIVEHWLKRSFAEFGIGAKTSVGYGYGEAISN